MKLSEMTTAQLVRTLCALTGPVCRIAEDEQAQLALEELLEAGLSRLPVLKAWSLILEKLSPLLLHDHAEDVWEIAGALLGKSPEQIRAQPAGETLAALRASWDGALIDFFSSAGSTEQQKC